MYCKWCGMESKDDKRCEWCGRPFAAPEGEQATTEAPPVTTQVPPVTTAVPEATTAMPPADDDPAAALPFSPRMSPLKPIRVEPVQTIPFGVAFENYLGVMLLLLAGGMALAHYFSGAWLGPLFALLFLSGLLMGTFRVIGFYDDEFTDVLILLVATMFVGPVYATVVYALIGLLRQDTNYSMLGLMASYLLVRLAIGSAAHGFADTVTYMVTFQISLDYIPRALQLFPACVLVGGWVCASVTRPLNE